jgi:hypothetical protein
MRTRKTITWGVFIAIMVGCLGIIGVAGASLIGCTTATVSEPSVCDEFDLGSLPASPVSVTLPPTTFSHQVDFSGPISKLQSVTNNLTTNVSQLTMSNNGDLNWLSEVDVTIQSGSMPAAPFAVYMASGDPGQEVSMQIKMDSATILQYLSQPATLTFTVQGMTPTQPVNFTNSMCVAVSGSFSKSL